jgi:signal transduction histidine kinase
MTATDLVGRLSAHKTLGGASRGELEWLVKHATFRQLQTGEVLSAKGARVEGMFIILSGRIAIFVDRGVGRHKVIEWKAGDIAGLLPFSRLVSPPADSVAQEPSEILAVHRDDLPAMIRECHDATTILVHSMLDRARWFTSTELHDEKMVSLGKLSAGLAHELNNPASAIERTTVQLEQRLEEVERASRALGAARLTAQQLDAIDAVRTGCVNTRAAGVRSAIEQAEREEAISDWLSAHALDVSIADTLADTAITVEALDAAAQTVERSALNNALRWAATGCLVRRLATEIRDAAARITALVTAIKGYTHMDQSVAAAAVDLVKSLDNTAAMLRSKARSRSAAIAIDVEAGLPHIQGFVGELNQVWMNLIDNAIDALPDSGGRIEVRATREDDGVAVRIIDNGAGIPDGIRDRIFDPFFTTKGVGEGTGLGLDIVRRLVLHNDGEISVESRPGRTEFCVLLPAAPNDVVGARA